MSTERPNLSPQLIAAMIESTPDRVRRRLDRAPDAAAAWEWRQGTDGWSVDTGGETVTLPLGHIRSVDQLRCTCLLSPRCFHVLACLTRLQVTIVESVQAEETKQIESPSQDDASEDVAEPDEKQQHAADELAGNLAQLLRVGVANAGVVVQSGLLRAVHQCRAEGLHRLAALGLRVIAGTREFRARAPASDPAQLAEDVADVLETSRHVLSTKPIAGFWIGTARRPQIPVRPRKLHGLLAEPIVTRSGFAGAAAYFLGEDDRIYSASEVRPGDAQLARDAYLGGIEIGSLIQPAKRLARGLYLGTDLTASRDGRLGRGKGVKFAEQGSSTWEVAPTQGRFRRPLSDQWDAAYAQAALPADALPAGWDWVFCIGSVLGAAGAELLFQPAGHDLPLRLAIANESESLCFRENLRMLSHAPGLRLYVIARMNLQEPRIVYPLAVAQVEGEPRNAGAPHLQIPESWCGRVCLGFDKIQSNHLAHAQATALVLTALSMQPDRDHPLGSLRRRWIATMLSGFASQRPGGTNTLGAETALLTRIGFRTGAALLDSLSRSHADGGPTGIEAFLATAVYLRIGSYALAKSRAILGF
jgi:hypothetical protein